MKDRSAATTAKILTAGLAAWAISCIVIHGMPIVGYIGLQVLTSGIFAWQMGRIEKSCLSHVAVPGTNSGEAASRAA